jgi:hypothetical protein
MPSTNADDGQDMPQDDNRTRQMRIDNLIMALAAIRPARGRADVERRRQIEAELVLLLEAEIASRRMARAAASVS